MTCEVNNDEETHYKEDDLGIKNTLLDNGFGSLKTCEFGFSYYAGWLGYFLMLFGWFGLMYFWKPASMQNGETSGDVY